MDEIKHYIARKDRRFCVRSLMLACKLKALGQKWRRLVSFERPREDWDELECWIQGDRRRDFNIDVRSVLATGRGIESEWNKLLDKSTRE